MGDIYAGYDGRIQYDEEADEGVNPGGAAASIDKTTNVSKSVTEERISVVGLDSRVRVQSKVINHIADLTIKGNLQNQTFIELWEDISKSYTFVVEIDPVGAAPVTKYEEFLGSKFDSLSVSLSLDNPVTYEAKILSKQWHDHAAVDPMASWAAEIATDVYTRRNVIVEKLIKVIAEVPLDQDASPATIDGANKLFEVRSTPMGDYDEDGSIDDIGDIVILVDGVADAAAAVDSSTGHFTTTTAPVTTITVTYIYKIELNNIVEATFEGSHGFTRKFNNYSAVNPNPEYPRRIEPSGAIEASVSLTADLDNLTDLEELIDDGVKTAASGTAAVYGLQLKFGTTEAGDFKIRATDGNWISFSTDLAEAELLSESLTFEADNLVIF